MRAKSLIGAIAGFSLAISSLFAVNSCKKGIPDDGVNVPPYYNLDVILDPTNSGHEINKAGGFIKFRQNPDTARIIDLETWVSNLEHNHGYLLQRAVNPVTDSSCTSIAWLTLGKGLVSQTITTDSKGNGHEDLFRNITSIARGTQFRIHFQIIDATTLETVLESDCYQYTVR
jgi:hypothetical protein